MNGWMNKFRNWMYRFMYGRYGGDDYGKTIFIVALIFDFLGILFKTNLFVFIAEILLIYGIYRILSKNIAKRSLENQKYLNITANVRKHWKVIKKNITDRYYHYYLCPKCKQIVRVPRGHGSVEIHCPKCGTYFTRKS